MDVLGREERRLVREKICPAKGPGRLSESERKRKAKEIIAASGTDTVEHFEKIVASNLGTMFREQAEWWLNHMQTRKRRPLASSTFETWRCCLDKWLLPPLGDLPLCAVDNDPVKELVAKMVASEELGPKSTNEYIKVVKMVVASAKDPKTRKQLYPVFWDAEYLDLPIVEKRNQKRPAFDSETVTRLVSSASWYVQIVYVLAAASGMRISEVLGLEIDFADNFQPFSSGRRFASAKRRIISRRTTPSEILISTLLSSRCSRSSLAYVRQVFCSPLGMESRSRTPTS